MNTADAIQLFNENRRSRNVTENTLWGYNWALGKMADVYPVRLPESREDIERLLNSHAELAPDSLQGLWRKLRTFWIWAEAAGVAKNVMADVPAPLARTKLPRTLEPSGIRRLLDAARSDRDYAVLALFLDSGVRVGELASLRRDDIQRNSIRVTGKVGDRIVPISPRVRALVKRQGDSRSVWIGSQGPLTISGLQRIVRLTMLSAGFSPPKIGPHTLRHTFALQYIVNGGDLSSLQRILGHRKVETTMIYAGMSIEMLTKQHSKYSPMARILSKS